MFITAGIGVALFALFSIFATGLITIFANDMAEVISEGTVILRGLSWSLIVLRAILVNAEKDKDSDGR